MTLKRKDDGRVPDAWRKPRGTKSEKTWGGNAVADEKRNTQQNLFAGTAEMTPANSLATRRQETKANARMAAKESRMPTPTTKSEMPKPAETKSKLELDMVTQRLTQSLHRVARNQGAAGVDQQSVQDVVGNWRSLEPKLRQALLTGTYLPGDIRRVWIPKSGGGKRGLGIPNVIDRVVAEAIRQVTEPRYEPSFHPNSHGFRPNRSCHTALAKAKEYLQEGYTVLVDIDLKDFFNRVHHQRLMAILTKDIQDKRVHAILWKMLKAKVVLPDGLRVHTDEGVPQGGPLSPLLSNIVLSELDKELSNRGLRFVRYADDCNIYVKSQKAGERVMRSISSFLSKRLRLEVNKEKSAVASPQSRHFLGFSLHRKEEAEIEVNLSERSHKRLRERIKALTPRNFGGPIEKAIAKVNNYLQGWMGFFGIITQSMERSLRNTDAHIRRRLRAMQLKQWKTKLSMVRKLIKRGASRKAAWRDVYSGRKGIWALSHVSAVDRALNNAYWQNKGLSSLQVLWQAQQSKRSAPEQMSFCLG